MSKRNFFIQESELDDYQRVILYKKLNQSYIVQGCAGSGKSILALHKAKEIQEMGYSVLYIVLTKALQQYMSDGIRQIGLEKGCVKHFHRCVRWKTNEEGNFYIDGWIEDQYDYIIIDEAQDFSIEAINMMRSNAKHVLIFGDDAQQLYKFVQDRRPASINEIRDETGYKTEPLVLNHRLPKKIARIAQHFNTEDDNLVDRCKNEGTEKPKILQYNSKEEQLNAIAELIQNKHMEDVGILFRNNSLVDEALMHFNHIELQVEAKSKKHTMNLDFTSSNPKLMTYHSAKGLQFEHVFLPKCITRQIEPLYVAITRAYGSLYIMHSGNLSPLFDTISPELYDTSLSTGTILQL